MDLAIDLAEIEKVKAEVWDGKVEIQLIGKDWANEVVLRGYTDGDKREVIAKLKELLAAVAKVLGYLDPPRRGRSCGDRVPLLRWPFGLSGSGPGPVLRS